MLRKRILSEAPAVRTPAPDLLDIPALATVFVTSEAPEHPVDHLFDAWRGPGGTRWVAGSEGEQTLILAFDEPRSLREVGIEAEEERLSRTQVLTLATSEDDGRTYRERIRQEFNFSPSGATFERETWAVPTERVTHMRLTVRPDKGDAPGRASLTTLTLR